LRAFTLDGGTASAVHGAVSLVIAVALVLYYRTLRRWGSRL
jgi:hypothetical protein